MTTNLKHVDIQETIEKAVKAVLKNTRNPVYRWQDFEDLCQNAWMTLYAYTGHVDSLGFVYVVASNSCKNYLSKDNKHYNNRYSYATLLGGVTDEKLTDYITGKQATSLEEEFMSEPADEGAINSLENTDFICSVLPKVLDKLSAKDRAFVIPVYFIRERIESLQPVFLSMFNALKMESKAFITEQLEKGKLTDRDIYIHFCTGGENRSNPTRDIMFIKWRVYEALKESGIIVKSYAQKEAMKGRK